MHVSIKMYVNLHSIENNIYSISSLFQRLCGKILYICLYKLTIFADVNIVKLFYMTTGWDKYIQFLLYSGKSMSLWEKQFFSKGGDCSAVFLILTSNSIGNVTQKIFLCLNFQKIKRMRSLERSAPYLIVIKLFGCWVSTLNSSCLTKHGYKVTKKLHIR